MQAGKKSFDAFQAEMELCLLFFVWVAVNNVPIPGVLLHTVAHSYPHANTAKGSKAYAMREVANYVTYN